MSKNSFTYGNIDSMNSTHKFVSRVHSSMYKEQSRFAATL
jgi:hypothetical protein